MSSPNILPLPYRLFLLYLEPLIFSVGGSLAVVLDPLSFQRAHAPSGASYSPISLTLANTVTLYQYAALMVALGLVAFLALSTALSLPEPRAQERLLSAIFAGLLVGDVAFASATIVPYAKEGLLRYLDLIKLVKGEVPFLMNPVLNVWLSLVCAGIRVMWFAGIGRDRAGKVKRK